MANSIEIELAGSTKKFISVGNQTFLNTKGQTETCRKGLKGQHCQRHHGGSVTSFAEAREKLDAFAERTAEKLSPFENGCVWLYSLLMRIPLEEARSRYINATAMYALIGVRKPHESEVKGLQKILLKLADVSQVTSTRMDNLKRLIKKMTVGNGFSEAGFYSIKDMVKDSTMKLKLGLTGVGVAGAFTLTGCSGQTPVNTFNKMTNASSIEAQQVGITTQLYDNGTVTDAFGAYQRTKIDPKTVKITSNTSSFTKEDVEQAKNFIVDFVATEALDSIALDDPSQLESWKNTIATKYLYSKYSSSILNQQVTPNDSSTSFGLILTNAKGANGDSILPQLMRDGKPRVANKSFGDKVEIKDGPEGSLEIYLRGSASFFADDATLLAQNSSGKLSQYVDLNGNIVQMTAEESAADLKKSYPSLADGKPQASSITYDLHFTLLKENGSWKIAGYSNLFESKRSSWLDSGSSSELHYRDEVK